MRWETLPQFLLGAAAVIAVLLIYAKACEILYRRGRYGSMVVCTIALLAIYMAAVWAAGGSIGDIYAPRF